ncbi:MAG TPA: hypothetical protein GXX51_02445 [Firmicutes bacterium]|nr:hypothetical protein [Bacillota bacterium]
MRKIWTGIVCIALIVAIYVGAGRWMVERANRTVELTMDYDEALALCRENGYPFELFLEKAKETGISSFALRETTVGRMAEEGNLHVFTGREIMDFERVAGIKNPILRRLIAEGRILPGHTYILPESKAVYEHLRALLAVRLKGERVLFHESGGLGVIELTRGLDDVLALNLGMPRGAMKLLRRAGLGVIPRFMNYEGLTPSGIAYFLDSAGDLGPLTVTIFDGDQVLGYRDHIGDVARELSERGISFGRIEFAKQKGDIALARALRMNVIRVHSITKGEMERISEDTAIERFVRAARERNMRVLYIRPFLKREGSENLIHKNLDYLSRLRSALVAAGFRPGVARPMGTYSPGVRTFLVLGAGILAGGLLLLERLGCTTYVKPVFEVVLLALGLLSYGLLGGAGRFTLARQAFALGAAVVFPGLAIIRVLNPGPAGAGYNMSAGEGSGLVGRALVLWLEATGVSVAGGLLLAGTLSSTAFMLQVDQFTGVKVMHVLPLLLALLVYWRHWGSPGGIGIGLSSAIRRLGDEPVRVRHLVALAVIGILGLIYIGRTGNAFGIPVSGAEEYMRTWLERVMIARPRTKEFLIGHPSMILAAIMVLKRDRRYLLLFALLGAIGQISMVNTFSHLHTPLAVTLLRTFNGLVLGAMIGVVLGFAYLVYLAPGAGKGRTEAGVEMMDKGKDEK